MKLKTSTTMSKRILLIPFIAAVCLVVFWGIAFVGLRGQKSVVDGLYEGQLKGYQSYSKISNAVAGVHGSLLRGFAQGASAGDVKQIESILGEQVSALDQTISVAKEMVSRSGRPEEEKKYYEASVGKLAGYRDAVKDVGTATDFAGLGLKMKGVDEKFVELQKALHGISEFEDKSGKEAFAGSSASFRKTVFVSSILVIILIMVFGFVGLLISRRMLSPLKRMGETLDGISNGDLTKRIDITSKDEIGEVALRFNAFADKLGDTITQFSKGAIVLSSTANTLDTATKQMISSVENAAMQVNSVATASEEMSTTSSEIAQNCSSAARSSEKANDAAVAGESIINETVMVMNRINGIVKTSARIIESLGDRSDQIGEVISLIDDIADQTNLLALNAAIEAARAGEHGRGFAVVADEVRKLAEKTSGATKRIGETIKAMQSETRQAVVSMEEGVKEVEVGTEEATKSGRALKDILKQINIVTSEVSQIAVASEEQTATTDEIANNIQQISSAMQETTKSVSDNADAAAQMAELSAELKKIVGHFRMSTPQDAQKMIEKGQAYIKAHGKEKAFAEFNNPKSEFIKGELFILAQNFDGVILAYGGNPVLVGKNLIDGKDPNGKDIGRGMIKIAKTAGSGWYEYSFMNPYTKEIMPKITYVQGFDNYYIACGVYK
jgi:methyl-accepting chemotaxis protein